MSGKLFTFSPTYYIALRRANCTLRTVPHVTIQTATCKVITEKYLKLFIYWMLSTHGQRIRRNLSKTIVETAAMMKTIVHVAFFNGEPLFLPFFSAPVALGPFKPSSARATCIPCSGEIRRNGSVSSRRREKGIPLISLGMVCKRVAKRQ